MDIQFKDLEKVTKKLLKHLMNRKVKGVDLKYDYYWVIDPEEKYKHSVDSSKFALGQLTGDWDILMGVLSGERDPIIYDLVWLGAILTYIGENMSEFEGLE